MEALFRKGDIPIIPEHFLLEQTVSGIKAGVVRSGNRKRLRRVDRTYEDLKQKQKTETADNMFERTCDYYGKYGKLPEGEGCEKVAGQIYQRVKGIAEEASFDEIHSPYLYRLLCYEVWIAENRIPEKKERRKDDANKPKVKRKGMSKKVCPNCGRKVKQQFIGLQHYKHGMSWKKDMDYFERTGDMVFAPERKKVGKKTKQCPVVRYK